MPDDTDVTDVPAPIRRYGVALVVALSGLFFALIGDFWMAGTSLALSVGSALLSWSTARVGADGETGDATTWARLLGYACIGVAAGLLLIDVLRDWV